MVVTRSQSRSSQYSLKRQHHPDRLEESSPRKKKTPAKPRRSASTSKSKAEIPSSVEEQKKTQKQPQPRQVVWPEEKGKWWNDYIPGEKGEELEKYLAITRRFEEMDLEELTAHCHARNPNFSKSAL
jgi:hypothetical protein